MIGSDTRFPTIPHALLILFVTLFLSVAAEWAMGPINGKGQLLLFETLTIVPVLAYVFIRKLPFRDVFRFRRVDPSVILVSGVIGLGVGIVVDEVDRLIQAVFPMPEEIVQSVEALLVPDSSGEFVWILLGAVMAAGLFEEMLFRGFFQGVLERHTHRAKAVVATAFVFAFMHFNPWWFVQIMIMGVVLSLLTLRCGSIFPAVFVHMVNNAVAVVLLTTDASKLEWYFFKGHVSPLWLVLGMACILWGFRFVYRMTEANRRVSS